MSRFLRWSRCAATVMSAVALVGSTTAAFGAFADLAGWSSADYSAAYAPYAASYNCDSCDSGCADGTCGPGCGCDQCGPSCGCSSGYDGSGYGDCGGSCGGGCGDGSCGPYGCGDGYGGCGDSYGGCGDCYGYGGDCGCDPYLECGGGCEAYYDNGMKCGRDLCLER